MKRNVCCLSILLFSYSLKAQNVGVGENSPGAKLTIRASDAFSKSLLIKTTANDTATYVQGFSHYLNGYTNISSATLTVNNRHFVPFDNPQISVIASGERSGINASGSLATINFRNTNNTNGSMYNFSSYLGNAATHNLGLYYYNPDDGDSKTLLYFTQSGNAGIGTFTPQNKLHVHNTIGTNTSYTQFTNTTTGGTSGDGLLTGINGVGHAFIYNQETTRLYFGTAGTTRMTISESGNVGIGIDPPTEKLDVAGNINASGTVQASEVHRTSTGSANLVPVAYGNISSTGFVQSGSGNITVSKISTGWYQVTITGEAYQFQIYTTVVTPAGNIGPIMTNTGSGGGSLHVYTYNAAGAAADSQFCFVVYKQ